MKICSLPVIIIITTLFFPVQFVYSYEPIYGSDIMSNFEREEYEDYFGSLKTDKDRAVFREEHKMKIQQRVTEDDIFLPIYPRP